MGAHLTLSSPFPCSTWACLHDVGSASPPVFKVEVMAQFILACLASFLGPSGNGMETLSHPLLCAPTWWELWSLKVPDRSAEPWAHPTAM